MSHPALQEKLLDYIACTGAVLEKTAAAEVEKQAELKKIEELIPQAVDALLENQRIEPHQKEAAARLLLDPVKALEILIKTAYHRNPAEQASLGTPVPAGGQQKRASANMGKRPIEDSEASRALKSKLGLPVD